MKHTKNIEPTLKQSKMIQDALVSHQSGLLDAAEIQYKKLLIFLPGNTTLLTNLGTIALQKGNLEDGLKLIGKSLQINSNQPYAINNKGNALRELNRLDEALASYDYAIVLKPDYAEAYFNRGNTLFDLKRLDEALASYERAIVLNPDYTEAYFNRGNVLQNIKRLEEALESYDRAIVLNPDYAEAYFDRGNALHELSRVDEALASYERAIAIKPDYAEANYNRGIALLKLKRADEALASYDRAIALKPHYTEAYINRGNALQDLKRLDEALVSYDRAIALKPDYAKAHMNRGNALLDLMRLNEALISYERAIALKPDYAKAYINRGNAFQVFKRLDEAMADYNHAIALKPDYAKAYMNRGNALQTLKRLDEALADYGHAISLKSDVDFILGCSLHTKMFLCIWDAFPKQLNELTKRIHNDEKVVNPFSLLALIDDLEIQKKTAEIYVKDKYPQRHILPKIEQYREHPKIRIGYFSADFHNHATMHLMAELFESHNKDKFELIAFSFGPDQQDEWRQRVLLSFDQFVDVQLNSDREIALLARKMEIDIAVDLKGFTQDCRTGIFAERSAPIQVNYLGYPGTMGADYMDYLIADSILIPENNQPNYSEKIVYLPDSYQVNLSKRRITKTALTRQELGLPDTGFIFCCFNNNYKITPTTFAGWIRILKGVEGSVLWLFESNSSAVNNLRKEAVKFGINEERLIFAKHLPIADHLNRIQMADLFMDTLPYNAHTTTSDALRMGLPVLTLIGHSFASRVAASLLNAVNLPEMITNTQEQYESLAIELAMHPHKLKAIKEKLVNNLPTAPLYNTSLFTQHLESAYLSMYDRYHNGLDPEHIYCEAREAGRIRPTEDIGDGVIFY